MAQTATATLGGTVVDASGATIGDASVVVDSRNTGTRRTVTTNADGAFTVASLPPGRYDVVAEREGFQQSDVPNVVLEVGDRVALRITLQVGSRTDAVTVTADTPRIRTTPGVATVVDRTFVANLPMNGRTFQSLLQLTPGTVPTTTSTTQQGQFSVNGARESANTLSVDGVSANLGISASGANFNGASGQFGGFNAVGATSSLVSLEALQEFSVQTSGFAPEYGRTPGGQVSIVTRSGTNTYSGSLFEYFRHDALNANDFFGNARGIKKPELRNNQFGGVLGGPIVLGHAYDGRNRSFFFVSYEGLRQRVPVIATVDVPSMASRQGATGAIGEILNAFPRPTGPDRSNGLAQFVGGYSTPARADATSVRLDHRAGERLTLFGRYNYSPSEAATRGASNNSLAVLVPTTLKTETLTLGGTSVLSSRALNELRVNISDNRGHQIRIPDEYGGATPPNPDLLFPGFVSPDDSVVSIVTTGAPSLFLGSQGSNSQRQLNIVDTFSLSAGSHQLKFGLDYRRLTPTFDFVAYQQTANFANMPALVAGNVSSAFIQAFAGPFYPRFTNLSLYAQDTWAVSSRLTLTAGFRYELNPAPSEKNGNNPRTVTGIDSPATIALAPPGTPPFKTTYANVAPRVGAAYTLSDRPGRETVFRGGIGVFYDIFSTQTGAAYRAFSYPYAATRNLANATYPFSAAQAAIPDFTTAAPYSFIYGSDPDLELPYTIQVNAGIERSFGASQTVSATYIRNAGRRLYRTEFYQSQLTDFPQLRVVRNLDSSTYDALQLQYRRRLSDGLQVLAHYTLSRSTDTASSEANMYLPVVISSPERDRGPSDFDRRHSYALAATYQIPAPRGDGWANAVLRDFSIDVIHKALSAAPVDIFAASTALGLNLRPDVVPGVPLVIDDPAAPGGRRINRTAFTIRSDTHGSLSRNALRGLPFTQIDISLRRRFTVGNIGLEARAEAFNALNQANFANPIGALTNSSFGVPTQMMNATGNVGGLSSLYQVGGPRAFQLAFRAQF